ncbi:MAG: acyl-CoA dehydrogenase [Pseudomonadota bacterium]
MDFALSDEQKMLVDGAQRYMRERYSLEARRATSRTDDGISHEHWKTFAELGWLALPVAEEHGGMGGSAVDVALLMEQLGGALVVEPVIDSAVLCGTLLSHATDASTAADLLASVATGLSIVALAHVEQDGRSEYDTPLHARARKTASGWQLDGIKHRVIHGGIADHLLVTAALDDDPNGEQELGVFIVDPRADDVTLTIYEMLDGTRAADINFHATALDNTALILRGKKAKIALTDALDRAVLAMSSAAVGSMDAVMAMTAEYLKTRVQFGQTLAKFQALQHRMAEMFVETDQARSIIVRALAAMEAGDADQRSRAVSSAKSLVVRAARFVTAQGIQLHGGIGTTEEYAVGHHYRAMLMYDYRFGEAAFHLDRSAGLVPASV